LRISAALNSHEACHPFLLVVLTSHLKSTMSMYAHNFRARAPGPKLCVV
jgi:hypothetical protein